MPSTLNPLFSNWPPLAFADAPFSVAKILLVWPRLPPPPDDAPVCVPLDLNPPPPPCCAPTASTPGISRMRLVVALIHRHVLDLVFANGPRSRGRFRIDGRRRGSVDCDG